MNKEELILKWLNNDLNDQEFEAFKALEDYKDLVKLNQNLQGFKADTYDSKKELQSVLSAIKTEQTAKILWLKPLMRVAAVIAICFSVYFYTNSLDTTVSTEIAEVKTETLPDASTVSLNAKSLLAYNKNDWKTQREVELQGEAFFKVAKGSTFNVNTTSGTVTVYGTQFNVKQRDNYFEVICYEGLVGVTYNTKETKLKPGDSFVVIDGKIIAKEKDYRSAPSWLNSESEFKSVPFKQVVAEFERQYDVEITLMNIDSTQLFTGSFTHENLELALKSIAVPLQVMYSKDNNSIILKRE